MADVLVLTRPCRAGSNLSKDHLELDLKQEMEIYKIGQTESNVESCKW